MASRTVHERGDLDEEVWEVPAAWRGVALPVRGFPPYRPFTPDPSAVELYDTVIAAERDSLHHALAASWPTASVESGTAALAGSASATPLGAAALAVVTECRGRTGRADFWSMTVDAWVARHGVVFAAEAALIATTMTRSYRDVPGGRGYDLTPWSVGRHFYHFYSMAALQRAREHLVAATDDDYRDAVARLGEIRSATGTLPVRIASSYLAPTEQSWVTADIGAPVADDYWVHTLYALLATAVTTAPQLKAFIAGLRPGNRAGVTTAEYLGVASRVGPAAAETIAAVGFVDHVTHWTRERTCDLADILSHLPTDEAFRLLLQNLDRYGVPTAAMAAAHRFPRRAMRLLSAEAVRSSAVDTLLRIHAWQHPDLAAEFGVRLPDPPIVESAELPELLRPRRKPAAVPPWLLLPVLPPLLTSDTARALPPSAVEVVCAVLARRNPDPTAIEQLSAFLDPMSLAGFAWGLFQSWVFAEYPAGGIWTLRAVGLFGDDEAARLLVPLILQWPRQSAAARAVTGLDVLADIGTPAALGHLRDIASRTRQRGFRKAVRAKLDAVAEQRHLTTDELADRAIPSFGLGKDGRLILDYGSRGFVIDLDERLEPVVFDGRRAADGSWAAGPRRKTLPKPTAQDDRAVATASYDQFTALRVGAKKVAREQIRRLEQAMVESRRWSPLAHRELFVDHPMLRQLARRLVWGAYGSDGTLRQSFRIAEDLTFADVEDDVLDLADDAEIGIAHPLQLGAAVAGWAPIFTEYAVLQPFSQLDRTFWTPDSSSFATDLSEYHGLETSPGRLLALAHRGWIRASSDGAIDRMVRPLRTGGSIQLRISPSLEWRDLMRYSAHIVTGVDLIDTDPNALDPVTASELVRELEALRAG
ncbi:DUF4132 domain-containing protein [Nocardia huaxiensis]|uniref:DUF4132 domain-containing protein n=1 Tax=Nocardia huaxiensis TaxID=2755382 RepID=UPI001E36D810|nr:DUF4132 domain-containing protein [Nocardia huaxiensis]UFS98273.1 DUF4132 domain-containing protein [Nocardia huaxiensis]